MTQPAKPVLHLHIGHVYEDIASGWRVLCRGLCGHPEVGSFVALRKDGKPDAVQRTQRRHSRPGGAPQPAARLHGHAAALRRAAFTSAVK